MNVIILSGRLVRKPELRTTSSGKQLCRFTIAVDRTYKNSDGEYDTDFVECLAFGYTADNLAKYQDKGGMIELKGRLEIDTYQDEEGKNRSKTLVKVETINYINKPKTSAYEPKNDQIDPFETMGSIVSNDDLPF